MGLLSGSSHYFNGRTQFARFLWHCPEVSILRLQLPVDAPGLAADDQVDAQPDQGVAGGKNGGEDADAGPVPGDPAVEEVHQQVVGIQNAPVDGNGADQGQAVLLIDGSDAGGDEGHGGGAEDAGADFTGGEGLHLPQGAQNTVDNCQHQRTAGGAGQATEQKFLSKGSHKSYLRLIWAKHRRDTYSR